MVGLGDTAYIINGDPAFRVIRRDEFDHWLVKQGRARGIQVREGEAVLQITPHANYIEVETERATIHAKTVVAADGSRSFVRRKLKWHDSEHIARLLEILTPEGAETQAMFDNGVAILDFNPLTKGLQGYYWDFPSVVQGKLFMNRGVFDSRAQPARPRITLKQIFQWTLAKRNRDLTSYQLKGHPIHWFNKRGPFSMPRVLLVGDAAGVDAFVGEGISFALGYGPVAAKAIHDAFARQDFSYASYRDRILSDKLLFELRIRTRIAKLAYSLKYRWQIALIWLLGGFIIRAMHRITPNSWPFTHPRKVKLPQQKVALHNQRSNFQT